MDNAPGKTDFDELHSYESYKLIDVAKTGLGKKEYPRMTIISTNGNVRGGPFDDRLDQDIRILNGEEPDNGRICFIARLDDKEEVHDKAAWHKANPSLYVMPTLMQQLESEYADYLANPAQNISFMSKRMNLPPEELENEVTSWDNILATNQLIDEKAIYGHPCVAGIDYMKTTDFLGAGLLYRVGDKDYWITHTWICSKSADLSRIKAPLREWESQGLLTFVESSEIAPELPAAWLAIEAAKRNSQILKIGVDSYRYQLLANALLQINFSADKGYENVIKLRPSDEMLNIPLITSGFVNQRFCWNDNPLMRWACNNSKTVVSPAGNITYGKIEPKSRKTDPFKAFVAAECVSKCLDAYNNMKDIKVSTGVYTY
jgi:phage terminase large subunit-like protein